MIEVYEEKLLAFIDNLVETATDDELFASGYLRGHISLAASDCEQQRIADIEHMKTVVEQSLKANANELSPADQALVINFWHLMLAAV